MECVCIEVKENIGKLMDILSLSLQIPPGRITFTGSDFPWSTIGLGSIFYLLF